MDGTSKQAEMAEQVKREIKRRARRHRGEHMSETISDITTTPQNLSRTPADARVDTGEASTETRVEMEEWPSQESMHWLQHGFQQEHSNRNSCECRAFEGSDTVLSLFYLEKVLPFIFPFYDPSLLQGGKAWILEMIIRRPAVRQAILCQGFYFSLAYGTAIGNAHWEQILTQAKSAYWTLRESLQKFGNLDIIKSLGCTIRIMAGIMQVHRFEITILSFDNWQIHLETVVNLLKQILDSDLNFNATMSRLGPQLNLSAQTARLPSAEQAAFRFSSTLIIFDDIIASTTLQKKSKLYHYHHSLLYSDFEQDEPPIDVGAVLGVENWVLLQISEIACLDAWKVECRSAGSLDVMKLAHRAISIKEKLTAHLTEIENKPARGFGNSSFIFASSDNTSSNKSLVTRIWAHATIIYLLVVTSGWQPANVDIRYHVGRVVELLVHQNFPPSLLRTVVWPFCVAGCLAEPGREAQFRRMVQALQPPNLFGKVYKAFEIIENTWKNLRTGDTAARDLSACFRSLEDPVLLV